MRARLYREHKYVSAILNRLERLIGQADFNCKDDLERIRAEYQEVHMMLLAHAKHENENFHALLEKKGSKVHLHAHLDHDEMSQTLVHLQNLLDEMMLDVDQQEAGYHFYLEYRKFVGDNLLHLHEEETKILPELQRLYSDDELRKIEFPIYEQMTPAQLIHMVSTLFPHMNLYDKDAFLADIQHAQPVKFAQIWEQADQFLNQDEQIRFLHNHPELEAVKKR
ncbi:MAG: hemerythrin domain-containing protein [Simkania sp.]|nr:hemerythrin domain-containing protein [Simkania sp.]